MSKYFLSLYFLTSFFYSIFFFLLLCLFWSHHRYIIKHTPGEQHKRNPSSFLCEGNDDSSLIFTSFCMLLRSLFFSLFFISLFSFSLSPISLFFYFFYKYFLFQFMHVIHAFRSIFFRNTNVCDEIAIVM